MRQRLLPLPESTSSKSDPRALLARFLAEDRSESVFAELVNAYGKLVYSSALRRTADPGLAEEVTQQVFAVLARKAESLRTHPQLTAWLFQTTRFESAKLLRTERRRQRRHAAYARHHASDPSPQQRMMLDSEEQWPEALPFLDEALDQLSPAYRDVILQRFYEGNKFREIASSTGRSEAACKMLLKRALKKLSHILKGRGVTLSATVIASSLGAELARSSPTISAVTCKALGTAPSLSGISLTLNSIQTMSNLKSIALTATLLILIATVPFTRQELKAHALRRELARAQHDRESLESSQPPNAATNGLTRTNGSKNNVSTAIGELLANADEPVDAQAFLDSMTEVMMQQDIFGMIKLMIPVTKLSAAEHSRFVSEVEAIEAGTQVKAVTLQMIGSLSPSEDPEASLDRMVSMGLKVSNYRKPLRQWAEADPEGALMWYQEKRQAGVFEGKGVQSAEESLLGELVSGMAMTDPDKAMEVIAEFDSRESMTQSLWKLADALGKQFQETGNDEHLGHLFALAEEKKRQRPDHTHSRASLVTAALRQGIRQGDFDTGYQFVQRHLKEPDDQIQVVTEMLRSNAAASVDDRAVWMIKNLPNDQLPQAAKEFVNRIYPQSPNDVEQWVESLEPGVVRDHAEDQLATSRSQGDNSSH